MTISSLKTDQHVISSGMTLKDGFPHLLANSWRSKPHKPAWVPQGLKVNCSFEAPGWRRHDLLALWDVYGMFFRVFSCETHVIFVCIYDNASFSSNIVLYFQAILWTHRTWFNYWSTVNLSFFFKHMSTLFSPSCLIYRLVICYIAIEHGYL